MVVGGGGKICLVGIYNIQFGKVWEQLIQDGVAASVAAKLGAMGADGASFTTTGGSDRAILISSPNHPSAILPVNISDGLQFFPALPMREKDADEHYGSASVIAGTKLWSREAMYKGARSAVAVAFCANLKQEAAAR
jgi:hypothetical protein